MEKTMTKPAPLSLQRNFDRLIGKYNKEYFENKIKVIKFFLGRKIRLDEEGLAFLSKYYESYDGNFKVISTTPTCDNLTFTATLKKTSSTKFDKTWVDTFTLTGVKLKKYENLFKVDNKVYYHRDAKIFRNP